MARIVLVFGHPSQDSLSAAIRDRAAASLRGAGHHVDVLDLGAIGFTPAMTPAERAAYHTATPVIDPVVAAHAELVKRADALLFVYPTWWSGLPAILKGWLDRLMVPTVAFSFDADNRLETPTRANPDAVSHFGCVARAAIKRDAGRSKYVIYVGAGRAEEFVR